MLPTNKIIRAIRLKQKLTQKELAKKLGVTTRSIQRWESGESYPRGKHFQYFLKNLEIIDTTKKVV